MCLDGRQAQCLNKLFNACAKGAFGVTFHAVLRVFVIVKETQIVFRLIYFILFASLLMV
jgi:hypothetical protein